MPSPETDTRERLLVAAEQLFARRGIANVGNRDIVEAAGQSNGSAIHYYFGSKAQLVEEIFARRVAEFDLVVNRAIDQLILRVGSRPDPHELVTEIWTGPYLIVFDPEKWYFLRFAAQFEFDPLLEGNPLSRLMTLPVQDRVLRYLMKSLPDIPEPVLRERWRNLILTVPKLMAEWARMLYADPPEVSADDVHAFFADAMVTHAAMLAAPWRPRVIAS